MNLKRLLPFLIVPLLLTACPSGRNRADAPDLGKLPRTILSGEQGPFHVQGIAVDLERGYIYFSFTTKLLKMDLAGNLHRQCRRPDGPSGVPDDESRGRACLRFVGI